MKILFTKPFASEARLLSPAPTSTSFRLCRDQQLPFSLMFQQTERSIAVTAEALFL